MDDTGIAVVGMLVPYELPIVAVVVVPWRFVLSEGAHS